MVASAVPTTGKGQGLSPRDRLFCHLYVANGHNATQAVLESGRNCTEKSAASVGSRLLRSVKVKAYLATLEQKVLAKLDSKAEEVLAELHHVGLARLSRTVLLQPDGSVTVRPLTEWTEHELAALSDVDVAAIFEGSGDVRTHVGNMVKLKMRGKAEALSLLAKHHELVDADKLEVTGNITITVENPYATPGVKE